MPILNSTKKDMKAFEDSLKNLSNSINNVTDNVGDISGQMDEFNGQVNSIRNDVKSLEDNFKDFMVEIKTDNEVKNAKSQIVELEKQIKNNYYKYDLIRNRLNDIINNMGNGGIDKKLLPTQSEISSLNMPNFYLYYILIAVSAWFKDEKKSAKKAIKNALNLDETNTSLFFSFLYLKLKRFGTAYKWIKRYLLSVNPNKIDYKYIDLVNYVYGYCNDNRLIKLISSYLNDWNVSIKISGKLRNKQVDLWTRVLTEKANIDDDSVYSYSSKYVLNYDKMKSKVDNSLIYNNIYYEINDLMGNHNYQISLDDIFNKLIFDYDSKEIEIRNNYFKLRCVIECNGNIEESNNLYEKIKLTDTKVSDLYTLLSDILLFKQSINNEVKDLVTDYLAEYMCKAFESVTNKNDDELKYQIQINEWVAETENGSDEKELVDSIIQYVKDPFMQDIKNIKYVNAKTIYSGVFLLIGLIVCAFNLYIGVVMFIVGLVMGYIFIKEVTKTIENTRHQMSETIKQYIFELTNTLAEIVDVEFIIKRNSEHKEYLEDLFESLKQINK